LAKAQNKTVETKESVTSFLNSIADASRRTDCFALAEIMKKQSGFDPKMWGPRIVGFGCIYIKKLQDVDTEILRKMVALSISHIKKLYT
jgi:hypothetical protein